MPFSYDDVTVAAMEAIAEMGNAIASDADSRRVASAGVYLLWAHLVGESARPGDDERMMSLVRAIECVQIPIST